MMEMVRNAVFNMVMSLYGCSSGLPDNTRCATRPAAPRPALPACLSVGLGSALPRGRGSCDHAGHAVCCPVHRLPASLLAAGPALQSPPAV